MTNITTTATTPDELDADDPRARLARAVQVTTAIIDGTMQDQLSEPTPCDDMDVRAMLGHLVMVLDRVAAAGRGEDPATWSFDAGGIADDQWLDAWSAAARSVHEAWADDAILERPTALPWAMSVGRDVIGVYLNEVVVHTWDLARATGQSAAWDDGVVDFAFEAIQREMPALGRAEMFAQLAEEMGPDAWEDPFGPAIDPPVDAPFIDRLVAWNGRDPGWSV